jgi:hypothetical protein
MIEGCLPFYDKKNNEIEKAHNSKERPPFRAPPKHYAYGLRELIEQCWSENPASRPDFRTIIEQLSYIQNEISQRNRWKVAANVFPAVLQWSSEHSVIVIEKLFK